MLKKVLTIMADGKFHSGQDLAQQLGVSRSCIWQQFNKLKQLDVAFSSVRGRGYRLQEPIELLQIDYLQSQLTEKLDKLEVLFSVDSTNRYLFAQAEQYLGQHYGVLAEMQTAGKGRRGRHWVSPFGKNIYLSVLTTLRTDISELGGFSLMMAMAVEQALSRLGVRDVHLKWPNDVYLQRKKLAGILLEISAEHASHCQLIIGIGLNFAMQKTQPDIDQSWSALKQSYPQLKRNEVASELLNSVLRMIKAFRTSGFAPWQEEWNSKDLFFNQPVQVLYPQKTIIGQCQGVNERGELQVQTDLGIQVISGGEVSLRASY